MSVSAEKLSELLSFYQRMSAYSLGGPAALNGLIARPLTTGGAFMVPTRTPSFGPLVPCSAGMNAGTKEHIQPVAVSVPLPRQSCVAERRGSLASTVAAAEQEQFEAEMVAFEGELIPAFSIGGERRLYMPILLRRLLERGYNDSDIQSASEVLKIHFQEASTEQVEALSRALKIDVPRCGLIKRSDAERLWSFLEESIGGGKTIDGDLKPSVSPIMSVGSSEALSRSSSICSPVASNDSADRFGELPTANSFKVYHACFGKQRGIFVPEWYTAPDARCVVCVRCGIHSSPERFVTHVHRATAENNVAHWGFDPAKWRAYLLLAKDQRTSKELRDYFESLKCKFDASRKRKVCSVALSQPQPVSVPRVCEVKKPRLVAIGVEKPLVTPLPLQQADFHEVPANFTLPAESVTIAQAALASARATSSVTCTSNDTTVKNACGQPTAIPDSPVSAVFVRELQVPQEAQEAEMNTIRELIDGRVLSDAEKNKFLSDATSLRRRQLALLSGVIYENVLLKQQLKSTKESSEKALAAFAAENNELRGERRRMEDELLGCRNECLRLREELGSCNQTIVRASFQRDCEQKSAQSDEQTDGELQVGANESTELSSTSGASQDATCENKQVAADVIRFEDISTDEESPETLTVEVEEGECKSPVADGDL